MRSLRPPCLWPCCSTNSPFCIAKTSTITPHLTFGKAMDSQLAPSGLSLLRLPPEIRRMIYEEVFDKHFILINSYYSHRHRKRWFDSNARFSILGVCQIIRAEALPYLYAHKPFILHTDGNPIYGIKAFIRNFGRDNANLIRRFGVFLGRYNASRCGYRGTLDCWSTWARKDNRGKLSLEKIGNWVRKFPQLKEFRLVYEELYTLLHERGIPDSEAKHATFLQNVTLSLEAENDSEWQVINNEPRWVNHGRSVQKLVLDGNHFKAEPCSVESSWFPSIAPGDPYRMIWDG